MEKNNTDYRCIECGPCTVDNDSEPQEFGGDIYCQVCFDDCVTDCGDCGELVLRGSIVDVCGQGVCKDCVQDHYVECSHCNTYDHIDNIIYWANADYCRNCYEDNCTACRSCEAEILIDDADENGDCADCHQDIDFMPSDTFRNNRHKRFAGIEIEFFADDVPALTYGDTVSDSSLRHDALNGYEYVSPPANGDTLLHVIKTACDEIKEVGGTVNTTCGLHVHIDARELTNPQRQNIYNWFRVFEPVFMGMVSDSRQNNRYCQPVRDQDFDDSLGDRYRTMNMQAFSKHGTIEFRLHQGTINAAKISNWVLLLLDFVDRFKDIETTDERLIDIFALDNRSLLLLLFQYLPIKLSLRKYIVSRLRNFKRFDLAPSHLKNQLKLVFERNL